MRGRRPMSNKTEIKVYLPTKLVGELESRKRAGLRSKFIEKAIRKRLEGEEHFTIQDVTTLNLMKMLHSRLNSRNDASAMMVQQFLEMEMYK
jgi:metal-responsive CopG/Arc/MetJ family transcriptional regulator